MQTMKKTFSYGLAMLAVVGFVSVAGAAEPSKQKTDGDSPTTVGPGSAAYKQKTDGNSPTMVGPGSGAYKQKTDGESPTTVGPGSRAYKPQ